MASWKSFDLVDVYENYSMSVDEQEGIKEAIRKHLIEEHGMQYVIETHAADIGLCSDEQELTDQFNEMMTEMMSEAGFAAMDDTALSEAFSNWSDAQCKDGIIAEWQYNNYSYQGR